MIRRLLWLAGAMLVVLTAVMTVAGAQADAIVIEAKPVPLDPLDPSLARVGRLEYGGGLQLSSSDTRFGGLSGLLVSADGQRLTAISDRGYWIAAVLRYDENGALAGIGKATITELRDAGGGSLARSPDGDAEGMTSAGESEGVFVSFETRPKLLLYPPRGQPPLPLRTPRELQKAPKNAGIETLTRLADGRLLALTEGLETEGEVVGWIGGYRKPWSRLTWLTSGGFQPTGAATLPSGDVLVLERRIVPPGARVRRLEASRIAADAVLDGEEIARFEGTLTFDNMEGIDARDDAAESLVYLVSDDNYSFLQRTLLLMFRISH
jgi:hypothetical protein